MNIFEALHERPQPSLVPVEPVYRVDFQSDRVRLYADIQSNMFAGVTSQTKHTAGDNDRLVYWVRDNGVTKAITGEVSADADLETKEDMHFGSFLHQEFEEFVTNGYQYDPLHIPSAVMTYCMKHHYTYDVERWSFRFEKALRAFSQWIEQEGITVLGVELPCILRTLWVDKEWNVTWNEADRWMELTFNAASCLDLVVRDKAGRLVIVDLKSGQKSYKGVRYYRQQLSFYKWMLLANYPEFREEEIVLANWSPKKWNKRSRGWYHYDEQQENEIQELWMMSSLFWRHATEDKLLDRNVTVMAENVITPAGNGVEFVTFREYVKQKIQTYLDAQKARLKAHPEPRTEQSALFESLPN